MTSTAPPVSPRFVTGPLFRHVAVMSTTSAIGLVAVFIVDLINLFYISQLGQQAIAAAVEATGIDPKPRSGRQERLENLWNYYI